MPTQQQLRTVPQLSLYDRLMQSRVADALVANLADVNRVGKQLIERSSQKQVPARSIAIPCDPYFRSDTMAIQILHQEPYLGGGFGHFYAYAPEKIEYAIDRFAMEVKRQLDRRLAHSEYIAGGTYTIADMAIFPWYGWLAKGWLYGAAEFLNVQDYKNVQRWADALLKRPAVKRGTMVNRTYGDPSSQLHERHDSSDFDTKTQDKLAAQS